MRSSLEDLQRFPAGAQRDLGYGIYLTQIGKPHSRAKFLHGDLSGVSELSAEAEGNTYRAVYTVKPEPCVYVLHCFEKKSTSGVATPKRHLELIRSRLREASADHQSYIKEEHAKTEARRQSDHRRKR